MVHGPSGRTLQARIRSRQHPTGSEAVFSKHLGPITSATPKYRGDYATAQRLALHHRVARTLIGNSVRICS